MKSHNVETTSWLTNGISEEQLKIEKALAVISAKIYTKRTKLGLDQKSFAKFMGVTQGMISRWESGTYNFSISTLIGICEKLNLSFDPCIIDRELTIQNIAFVKPKKTSVDFNDWVDWKPSKINLMREDVA